MEPSQDRWPGGYGIAGGETLPDCPAVVRKNAPLDPHSAAQATRLSVRGTANLRRVRRLQNTITNHNPPSHDHVTHVGGTRAVDNPSDEIGVFGLRVRTFEV